jgi:pyruvate,water dikinase
MGVAFTVSFVDPAAVQHDIAGGKGANLGRLTDAGFQVPPGFIVTTAAYDEFIRVEAVQHALGTILGRIDYGDADQLERETAEIRRVVVAAQVPESMAEPILSAYRTLAAEYVAVRSSGTAEDLAEASFAGLHDTYLDVTGEASLLDAIKRCWASLWTARATSYRHSRGFGHESASLAVVVQKMVASEVSGVMFTGNPLTARTDEVVINASWGLGEGIVSGIVTPDQYVVDARSRRLKETLVGDKAVQVVRDPETGQGVVRQELSEALREVACLSDARVTELAELGLTVTDFYGGVPQDMEWGYADGQFYLLQSRNITGVPFTWDEDINAATDARLTGEDTVRWSNGWAREFWSGALTPLGFSANAGLHIATARQFYTKLGYEDVIDLPVFKFRRSTAYYNGAVDALHYQRLLPRAVRAGALANVPPDDRGAALDAPWGVTKLLRALTRLEVMGGHGVVSWFDTAYRYLDDDRSLPGLDEIGGMSGLARAELAELSDSGLKRQLTLSLQVAVDFNTILWIGFFNTFPVALTALSWMLERWYRGSDDERLGIFQDLISGMPVRTKIGEENSDMWDLGVAIRESPAVLDAFERTSGSEFFEQLDGFDEGRPFLERYRAFVDKHGHGGAADRDLFYDRRRENPALDYEALRNVVAAADAVSPAEAEERQIERRLQAADRVRRVLRNRPFGNGRVAAFDAVLDYTLRFLMLRDNERWGFNKLLFYRKTLYQEVCRRLNERGLLTDPKDGWFLAEGELFGLLDGTEDNMALVQAKIAGRRQVFDRVLAREEAAPLFLDGNDPIEDEIVGDPERGLFVGTGTSRGNVTGRARLVPRLEEIGRIEKGEILVCDGTDPGWATVFLIIKGLVMQTGGMLAHGSCLSREFGLPAVTLPNAMNLIPDGALITVNGDTGEITVHQEEQDESAVDAEAEPTGVLT